MDSNSIMIHEFKNKKRKSLNNIIKFKNLIYILLLFFGIILISFFIFNDIYSQKLLIHILKDINSNNINNISLFNKRNKSTEIKDRINLLKKFTNNNPLIYKHMEDCLLNDTDKLYCFYNLINPKKVIGKNRILMGKKSDGCYVLLDDFKDIKIAYSFGISNMIQFDDALAKRGIDVYMYDHTINSLPYSDPKFHWSKIGMCGNNNRAENLKTLEDLMKENGHMSEKNMILKIDISGWEWDPLNELNEDILRQFKYIVIEYHFFESSKEELYYNVLKKIHKSHQAFYCRCEKRSIIAPLRNRICKFIEVSYIIREDNKFDKDDSIYPIFEFDFTGPKIDYKSEYNLNILKLFDFDE